MFEIQGRTGRTDGPGRVPPPNVRFSRTCRGIPKKTDLKLVRREITGGQDCAGAFCPSPILACVRHEIVGFAKPFPNRVQACRLAHATLVDCECWSIVLQHHHGVRAWRLVLPPQRRGKLPKWHQIDPKRTQNWSRNQAKLDPNCPKVIPE